MAQCTECLLMGFGHCRELGSRDPSHKTLPNSYTKRRPNPSLTETSVTQIQQDTPLLAGCKETNH